MERKVPVWPYILLTTSVAFNIGSLVGKSTQRGEDNVGNKVHDAQVINEQVVAALPKDLDPAHVVLNLDKKQFSFDAEQQGIPEVCAGTYTLGQGTTLDTISSLSCTQVVQLGK